MKTYTHIVVVSGTGSFPLDMLRYDRMTPATEVDSGRIALTFMRGYNGKEPFTITLRKEATKDWSPTRERWSSYMWRVEQHEVRG